ncbi:MAG: hypothetical protein JXA08_06955 [Methanomicrobiaceae archaeon]|nr:hypothetical protein [Methanomicrobiaceae archaeon]
MQLPRGTFHSLKKGMNLSSLLSELRSTGFSGHCSIQLHEAPVSLVFDRGVCILADVRPLAGTEGYDSLKKSGNEEINAELYNLNRAQIDLSIEFNKKFRVEGGAASGPDISGPSPASRPASGTGMPNSSRVLSMAPKARPAAPVAPLQMPRGTFHSLKKNVSFSKLIDDLREMRFSGYCNLAFADRKGTIVFEEGICMIADFPPARGSDALQELQPLVDGTVNAELYTLTSAQMQLTLEFNRDYRVSVATSPSLAAVRPQKVAERPLKSAEPTAPTNEELTEDFDEQMRAIESMDLDSMAEQSRESFKDILNRLQLDYLLEREEREMTDEEGAPEEKETDDNDKE